MVGPAPERLLGKLVLHAGAPLLRRDVVAVGHPGNAILVQGYVGSHSIDVGLSAGFEEKE